MTDEPPRLTLDRDDRSFRYYRNAVERHWDPGDVDLSTDAANLAEAPPEVLDGLRASLGKFGAGEQAVTEDLSPLAQVLAGVEDQVFVTTQLYEEAKHTDFFDRYWREVVHEAEAALGLQRSSPTDDAWFNDAYDELFDRNERAMDRLLVEDTPETRATAYCHYHLVIEGVLAQTGYWGLTRTFSADGGAGQDEELPHLPGLVEGLNLIRGDEGRHVGFGMAKLKEQVQDGLDPDLLYETTNELLELVQAAVAQDEELDESERFLEPGELERYAADRHTQRMQQIVEASAEIPDVDELTKLEG